jgi:hypothetical protein
LIQSAWQVFNWIFLLKELSISWASIWYFFQDFYIFIEFLFMSCIVFIQLFICITFESIQLCICILLEFIYFFYLCFLWIHFYILFDFIEVFIHGFFISLIALISLLIKTLDILRYLIPLLFPILCVSILECPYL